MSSPTTGTSEPERTNLTSTNNRGSTRARDAQESTETTLRRTDPTWTCHSNDNSSTNLTELHQEDHLNLGPEETEACFMRTKMILVRQEGIAAVPTDPKKKKASTIYRELYALNGSITGRSSFNRNQLKAMNKLTNTGLRCKVHNNGSYSRYYLCCALRVRVPIGLHVAVEISEHRGSKIRLFDSSWVQGVFEDFRVTDDNVAETRVFVGSSNVVDIIHTVDMYARYTDDRYHLRFQALSNPGLQSCSEAKESCACALFLKGVVQTPMHKGHTILMNPLLNPHVTVRVPSGHVIMVSFPGFEVMTWCVTLRAEDKGNDTLTDVCPENFKPPHALTPANTWQVGVYFYSNSSKHYHQHQHREGFQLFFSFHSESSLPTKLPDGLWNCSVPHSTDFLYHLSCNLEVECHDAEDEVNNCSYASDLCEPGYLTLGGACFLYVRRQEEQFTSLAASDVCLRRHAGDRLAILNTADKWMDAVRVLPFSKRHSVHIFVGIRNALSTLRLWYTNMFQWADDTTALYLHSEVRLRPSCWRTCGYMAIAATGQTKTNHLVLDSGCEAPVSANILCEKQMRSPVTPKSILPNGTEIGLRHTAYVECPLGHYVHRFLVCDVTSSCGRRSHSSRCELFLTSLPPSFACANQMEYVPYTLVCDHRADCVDGSDEDFCRVPSCRTDQFSCDKGQCIPSAKVCDGWEDCNTGQDEHQCTAFVETKPPILPPALVILSDRGRLVVRTLSPMQDETCPYTHFQCPDNGYCLPLFLRCNDVYDCPGREDESGCDDSCPGFYRCRASQVCVVHSNLCDGHPHCPQHDDEVMCDATCPPFCVCWGLAFFCERRNVSVSAWPLLRYLDASGSGIKPIHLIRNYLLIYLDLANCSLTHLDGLRLPNLLSLNIQDNELNIISPRHLDGVPQLRELFLAANPLEVMFDGGENLRTFPHMLKLNLSRVVIHVLNVTALSAFPNLLVLNLSHSGVQSMQGEGFRFMEELRVVDLRGCPMTDLPRGLFQGLANLREVYADSYKICCPTVLPLDFSSQNCFAPSNEISSCDDLLRGNEYSICVFVLSVVAIVGNAVSFIFRTCVSKRENKLGYGKFVTHLSVSDFLMGVYLAIIGVADQMYHGTYLWNDITWRYSAACQLAGFLSLLSSEVSALIMCLITLDRFLVLRFPFSPLHFSPSSAHAASLLVWICGVFLVSVPLLPATSHWEFYTQTSICIPLPITSTNFAGHLYSFSIIIVFNFVVFVFISLGQLSIYWSVRANSMAVSNTTKKSKDLTIARRLITVAMSDFVCWFPIGVLGLMASEGVPIPGEVNVAVAIFVLPLNSAVNPCLYTLNIIMERHRRAREEKLRESLLVQLKGAQQNR